MAVSAKKIVIVGCGPGSPDYVTPAARQAALQADVLLGSARLLKLFPESDAEKIQCGPDADETAARVAELLAQGRGVAVLVSGDPGLFSLAQGLVGRFGAAACEVIPAVSSVQVAFARLGLGWADARMVSAHGRTPQIEPAELAVSDKIAILCGTVEALAWTAATAKQLKETHAAIVCENLTLADERMRRLGPEEIAGSGATSLTIVLLVRRTLIA
jgi:precorrin-6y C5,15-methyltransferase (decarboxylating) CbiE subunit